MLLELVFKPVFIMGIMNVRLNETVIYSFVNLH